MELTLRLILRKVLEGIYEYKSQHIAQATEDRRQRSEVRGQRGRQDPEDDRTPY